MPLEMVMSAAEASLFEAFAKRAKSYLEWGAGGSTLVAARLVGGRVTSVESSQAWLDRVDRELGYARMQDRVRLHRVDIGPVGEWGWPAGHAHRYQWPGYYGEPYRAGAAKTDAGLVLVDGRFRVACFARFMVNAPPTSVVLVHDYANRPEYHVIGRISREIAAAENLSAFQLDPSVPRGRYLEVLREYGYDPR
jgi:hypothetical protein